MFAKLLKYEWRSNAATCSVLSLCALGVAVLGGFVLRGIVTTAIEDFQGAIMAGRGMLLILVLLSLVAYSGAVYIIQLVRFYKSRFTDEGYLTFTLPVNAHQIFGASLVNLLIWTLISGLVLSLCIFILYLFATVGVEYPINIWELLSEIESELEYPAGYNLVSVLSTVCSSIFSLVMPLTCLTVGASIARKHKILAAFGIYYGISMAIGFVESVMMTGTLLSTAMDNWDYYLQQVMTRSIILAVIQLVAAVAGYFVSTTLMTKKLNLS